MTYEERKRWLCQQCGKQQCGYANRGLQDKCPAIQEKMEGWELGYQDAIDNPTGGELLHVLEKGRKIGFQDAIDKASKWLIDNLPLYFGQINADNTDRFVRIFKKAIQCQERDEENVCAHRIQPSKHN